jgi:Protein of unknown function (DUF1553)/Protein of unknown function (DUF1549)
MAKSLLLLFLLAPAWFGDDPNCPAYPAEQRKAMAASLELQRSAQTFALAQRGRVKAASAVSDSGNLIDAYIFGKMIADGVEPAPLATDEEILRRMYLDMTGRIPTLDAAADFLNDANPGKRAALIDQLMASEAFVDYWTFFFANHFEVTSRYYQYINIPGRNLFYENLREFVSRDRSYRDFATELITAVGDSYQNGSVNFLIRGYQPGDPIQDTWDTITDRITTKFLGVQTQCVSCHDGRNHLEPINTYLAARKREEFWRQSAFISRTNLLFYQEYERNFSTRVLVYDRAAGAYTGGVSPANPGPRPARAEGPFTPSYMFNKAVPESGEWRSELARFVADDRQFARATVNYIWAHFFNYGIVDPPNAWDLARIDPANPPPAPWPLQASHPELLERLADEFIQSNYSIRRIIRLIAESNAYQLSSRYGGAWRPEFTRYFAKHFPRRLYAEEIFDALTMATDTPVPMNVEGFDSPIYFATKLPDPTEPRNNGTIINFLTNFGRGDWWTVPRDEESNVLQVLYQMNDGQINLRTLGSSNVTTRVTKVMLQGLSDRDAVNQMFLATLGRYATDSEFSLFASKKTNNYEQWLSDIQWVLLNKVDFVFSY